MTKELIFQIFGWIKENWLWVLIIIFGTYYALKWIIRIMRFINLHFIGKHLVYLKVTLPRSDSKMDTEKRTEKDFKEKVAIMAQLYRALYEIRELNLLNLIKTKIWQADNVSFEVVVENHQLDFYVVVNDFYKNIVEKQITTFYKDADVKEIKDPPKIFEKGSKIKSYFMYTKRNFWFPIHTYKAMEQDPLNELANVLSKLENKDKAAIQMIINPVSSSKWTKTTEEMGTRLFKNQKLPIKINIPVLGPILSLIINMLRGTGRGGRGGTNAPGASGGDSYIRMLQTKEEAYKKIGEKAGQVGFDTSIRIVGASSTSKQATEITNNLNVAFGV